MVARTGNCDPESIEPRWQERWRAEGTYEIENDDPRPPVYALSIYPYLSDPAHVGHVRNYTFGDLLVGWSQWIFLRLYKAGLVVRNAAPVNGCPGCQTVQANEQVLSDGTCERSGDLVERRDVPQWFYRIMEYAQELVDDLDELEWPEQVETMQRNWIGRSDPRAPSSG